ncbi:MAG: AMP-dependent synthetase and ligase [Phenylobacterium sp.]|nr:AMP-dependent synthetase and ligase [Phenylobacterium sp.]
MTDANGAEGVGPRGLGHCLTLQAERDPDRPALTFEGETLTRAELDRQANRMARALAAEGVGQDDLVGIFLPNGFAHHVVTFAIWKLGASPLPLPSKLPDAELSAMVELARPKLVVGAAAGRLPGVRTLPAEFRPDPALSDAPLPEKIARSWKAIGSGGSTGRPKIIVDGAPAVTDPDNPSPLLQIGVEDVLLHPAPIYHNAPFAQTNWALCWGGHVIEVAKFDAREWLRLVEAYKVRWAYLVPTMMSRIWALPEEERNRHDLSSLRVVMHMAAPCPAWLKQAWIDWLGGERIYEVYAGTESIGGTLIRGDEWLAHPGSVGRPTREVKIIGEDGQACAVGEVGEIWFAPPAEGERQFQYIGAEKREREGWRSLGDMGSLDADGYLYLADRRTDMIVSGGANIYPAEIESALEAHPAIASSTVVGLPHPDFGRVPHAIVELRPGASLDAADLEAFLAAQLARYKLPHTFEISDEPLRDDAGKVRRSAWRDACEARLAAGQLFAPLRARDRVKEGAG